MNTRKRILKKQSKKHTNNGLLSCIHCLNLFLSFLTFSEFLQDAGSDFKAISSSPHVRVFESKCLILFIN